MFLSRETSAGSVKESGLVFKALFVFNFLSLRCQ